MVAPQRSQAGWCRNPRSGVRGLEPVVGQALFQTCWYRNPESGVTGPEPAVAPGRRSWDMTARRADPCLRTLPTRRASRRGPCRDQRDWCHGGFPRHWRVRRRSKSSAGPVFRPAIMSARMRRSVSLTAPSRLTSARATICVENRRVALRWWVRRTISRTSTWPSSFRSPKWLVSTSAPAPLVVTAGWARVAVGVRTRVRHDEASATTIPRRQRRPQGIGELPFLVPPRLI